jgi:hypothetical protein
LRSSPWATRNVFAMPPPTISTSRRGRRFSSVSILSSILAPPEYFSARENPSRASSRGAADEICANPMILYGSLSFFAHALTSAREVSDSRRFRTTEPLIGAPCRWICRASATRH